MRWSIRQYRTGSLEETQEVIDEVFTEAPSKTNFESAVFLETLLDKAVSAGILLPADRELLVAYELENLSGQELGRREGLAPKALSYRVRSALARLERAFRGDSRIRESGQRKPSEP